MKLLTKRLSKITSKIILRKIFPMMNSQVNNIQRNLFIFKHVEKKTNVTISATKDNNTKVLTLGLTGSY